MSCLPVHPYLQTFLHGAWPALDVHPKFLILGVDRKDLSFEQCTNSLDHAHSFRCFVTSTRSCSPLPWDVTKMATVFHTTSWIKNLGSSLIGRASCREAWLSMALWMLFPISRCSCQLVQIISQLVACCGRKLSLVLQGLGNKLSSLRECPKKFYRASCVHSSL